MNKQVEEARKHVIVGEDYRFDYPKHLVTIPECTAHAGQTVKVTRQLTQEEADQGEGMERMFEFEAADGFVGHAFESELCDLSTSLRT